jgi:tripeptide aminopeptidase
MDFEINEQYRNMRYQLDKYPQVMANALRALQRLNIEPIFSPIRGGTDGSRLSYMGLPTPNLFAGQHNLHSKLEWVSVEEMQLAVKTIITLCQIWEEQGTLRQSI